MLTVAGPSSGTEAERLAHRLFTMWDSGTGVLGGVAAFRPYEDPETRRRQSDVVLVVPDGVIVLRLVGSQRQSGPVVTHPTGAWTMGGEVLRISGGGSNPLPGLRDGQAAVAATLRASGLEPGRVAMLVAVGAGDPVEPQDGQLTDGIVVCPLSDDGLAIGIRRAAALTAAADVRQWTTADVKAALASIGATGRVPAVEELNSEGFMYSPYVLRRPDLVAAASAVAASAAESAAGNVAQADPGVGAAPLVPDDGGPPTQATRPVAEGQDADVGLSGLLSEESGSDHRPPAEMPPVALDPYGMGRDEPGGYEEDFYPDPDAADSGGRRRALGVAAVVLIAALIAAAVYVGFQMFVGDSPGGAAQTTDASSGRTSSAAQPSTQQIRDNTYTLALFRDDTSCAGNANGQVADYFGTTDCTALVRELYTSSIDGVPVLVSVARVTMPDEASASEFKTLVDSDGTGNVDDLFEAGESLPNGPTELVPETYASELNGMQLTIVVAGWADPAAPGDAQALEQMAIEALALEPQG